MNPNSNELLGKILGVCIQIRDSIVKNDVKDSTESRSKNTGIGGLDDILSSSKILSHGSETIKDVIGGLGAIGKIKINSKNIDAASKSIRGLFETVAWIGEKRNILSNALGMFESLSKSLKGINEFGRTVSTLLLSFGGSILLMTVGLWTAGKLLGTTPLGTFAVITGMMVGMVGVLYLLGKVSKYVGPGITTAKGIGESLLLLSGGMLAFVVSLRLISMGMDTGDGLIGVLKGVGMMALIITGIVGLFALIGIAGPLIGQGIGIMKGMAIGMLALSAGVLAVALVGVLISKMATMTATKEESTGIFGSYGPMIKGLGIVGITILGAVGLFAVMGALAEVIVPGVATGILIAVGMIAFAFAVKKMYTMMSDIDSDKLSGTLKGVIGGLITGITDGFAVGVTGGKKGFAGLVQGVKSMVAIGPALGLLMAMSVSLSMFAYALSAFVNLGNMRVIESYDKTTGKPVFGPTVNIKGVGSTVAQTVGDFIKGLITSTFNLKRSQASALGKMSRVLTGRRGLLAGVIQFADVLKTFAEFGPNGEIGFVDLVPDGTDQDGNAKFKKVPSKVKITTVVRNITDSYLQFVSEITKNVDQFGITGDQGAKMANLGAALMGTEAFKIFGLKFGKDQPGLLAPIKMFADTLTVFAKFGSNNEIAIFDETGKPTGNGVPVTDVAKNIIRMLVSFSDTIASDKTATGSVDAAVEKLTVFDKLIKKLGEIGTNMDPITKLTNTIGSLADNFSRLTTSVADLNVDKMSDVARVGDAVISRSPGQGVADRAAAVNNSVYNTTNVSNTVHQSAPVQQRGSSTGAGLQQTDLDALAQKMGNIIAAKIIDADRNKMFRFEFAGKNDGVLNIR